MGIRRTKHAVYDLKHHLVWIPKYRKHVLSGEVSEYLKEVLQRIAEEYAPRIDTMEVMEEHVPIFVEVPPRYSPAQIVQILKSVSVREVFKKFARENTYDTGNPAIRVLQIRGHLRREKATNNGA